MSIAVDVQNVTKRYGKATAVDGLSLEVRSGEIFGIIGPNGAGKTTLVECMEGLRKRDSGTISVLGRDPDQADADFYRQVGVQLQSASLLPGLRVGEIVRLFASFYDNPRDPEELLAALGLAGLDRKPAAKLSGGQRQRVLIATALIGTPDLVFLDELTTGLDPQSRLAMLDVIRQIRDDGATVVLTTHFMAEAEALCDRVLVADNGKVIATGTVPELIAAHSRGTKACFGLAEGVKLPPLSEIPGVSEVQMQGREVSITADTEAAATRAIAELSTRGVTPYGLEVTTGSLEDVFLTLTGRQMRAEEY